MSQTMLMLSLDLISCLPVSLCILYSVTLYLCHFEPESRHPFQSPPQTRPRNQACRPRKCVDSLGGYVRDDNAQRIRKPPFVGALANIACQE